jgi:energy-coupling factor transporter ATP-binding protein EcfA2
MIIIALKGKNGSGKSTVAAMLAKKLDEKGISNKVLSFAEPLKKIVNYIYDDVIDFENRKEKENNRNLLETTADAIKSSFSFNPFAEELVKQIKDYDFQVSTGDIWETKPSFVIVSDLRFDSEHFALANCIDNDWEDELIVVEIQNILTQNNPSEYDLDLIKANKTLIFGKDIEVQLDSLIKEIL